MSIFILKLAYIVLTVLMNFILIYIGFKAIKQTTADPKLAVNRRVILIGGLLLWQVYTFLVAMSGILNDFSFPPRLPILLIFPLFAFTGIFVYKHRKHNWIAAIPMHWLFFFQSFRILVELIFVFSVAHGVLNPEVTIEGYNFDMIFGASALIVGLLAYKQIITKKWLILWNYLGLMVLASVIFLFMSSIFNPQLFGAQSAILPKEAMKYPYVLVAGFLMPLAVFVHVLSIAQLSKK